MKITKKLAVALHRKLWNWIAEETETQQRCVQKWEYPYFLKHDIRHLCFCCEYTKMDCDKCPIKWNIKNKNAFAVPCTLAEFGEWRDAVDVGDWHEAARIARVIAELPEREENKNDKSKL